MLNVIKKQPRRALAAAQQNADRDATDQGYGATAQKNDPRSGAQGMVVDQ